MMEVVLKYKEGPGNVKLASIPIPEINPDQVLVEVKVAGICGTDSALYHWKESVAKGYDLNFPLILGHEFAGVVSQVGSEVKNIKTGDRVTANPIHYCGQCNYCVEGRISICEDRPMLGAELNGAFAQYVAVRAQNILKLPENVSFKSGAVMEPLCVAIHAVERVQPELGEVAVVIGAGAIGLLILMVLKTVGVSRVIVTGLGVDKERLQLAKSLGAETINVEEKDPLSFVKNVTGGKGADVVFEAAGHSSAVLQAIKIAANRGRIGLTGFPATPTEILTTELALKEISLVATRAYDLKTWIKARKIVEAGLIDLEPIATHTLTLRDWENAFSLADKRQGLRILLTP